ncbi:M23 family metallopeptidase [Ferdinandcohnia quinoae]|uniref:M23 family metallopeptidase n=1 Tax=Fredinandcohnia quinoae TaxID=2918902 RepID=A0AAW5E1R7_9BACI|nr:M23 family metallopeptidase [Fredinandcohnia sp. SECRCQ15]MCH1626558.1 M23 family metallopeptidase [Fredinandcohnia sp. SECRCQ15]
MSNRANEIRKRIAKRKRERNSISTSNRRDMTSYLVKDEEKFGGSPYPTYEGGGSEGGHPLFKKEVFLFKVLLSVILVLGIGIIFKNQSPMFEKVRTFVSSSMNHEFQFAAVTTWYEEKFGSPLAILPASKDKGQEEKAVTGKYVAPAFGKITESFEVNGQGIMVETNSKIVEAMNEGKVLEVANKEELGKTVVIQHADGSETWYGNLKSIDVKLYDFVQTGQELGKVMDAGDESGTFYFAIKQGEKFIDPIQVIKFE